MNEYRELPINSSSSLKDFSFDRKKYYKRYILNEEVEDRDTQASIIGRMVETLVFEEDKFDDRFYMSACLNPPTEKMLEFVESLYGCTLRSTDEYGNVTVPFIELCEQAYTESSFKLPFKTVMNRFVGSDAEIYYNEIRTIRSKNLTPVTVADKDNAERVADGLRTSRNTASIINLNNSKRYAVGKQFQIVGFSIDIPDLKLKSMLDLLVVDRESKTVQIYDLKCTWSVENFFWEYYLKRRAYIQAYVYYKAVEATKPFDSDGYKVMPPKFIVCDSINYYEPLIYEMTDEDLENAYNGFDRNNISYPGVKEIIEELYWALENDIWNISKKNYLSNGIVKLG